MGVQSVPFVPVYRASGEPPRHLQLHMTESGAAHRSSNGAATAGILAILLCVLAVMMLRKHMAALLPPSYCPHSGARSVGSRQHLYDLIASRQPVTVLFYAPWCGHCNEAKPQFESAAAKSKAQMVTCNADPQGDSSILSVEDLSQLGIDGFPSVMKFGPENKYTVTYSGPRTEQAYQDFAEG